MIRDYLLIGVFLTSLLSALFSFYNRASLHKERAEVLQKAKNEIEMQLVVITDIYEKNQEQTKELMRAQQSIGSHLLTQQQETRRLQNEVQEVKEWANSGLPSDIIRLRQRPAIIGSEPYHGLPTGGPLHIKPKQPTD